MTHLTRTLALCCAMGLWGCQESDTTPPGPDAVLLQFTNAMRQVHGKPEAGDEAASLVWKPARDNLKERARRASALSGRELSAGELIVPSWFALYVSPERVEARIDGDWAEVTVFGSTGESAQARCIREEDGWKVALELPPLAPIRVREDAE